jgi:acyl-CoA thioesterase-1
MRYGLAAPLCKFFFCAALLIGVALASPSFAAGQSAGADEETSREITIVALGDSLTAGYLLGPSEGFADRLQAALHEAGHDNVKILNAGVSGDTSAGGLARLDWAVGPEADAVIVELGANDALRAINPDLTRKNLEEIVSQLKARGLPVLLAGMLAPPNLGRDYGEAFNTIYPDLASEHDLILYPFFLEGVAGERSLNLADGIHPTAEGIDIIVGGTLPSVEKLIAEVEAK